MSEKPTTQPLPPALAGSILRWQELAGWLVKAKDEEMNLRKAIATALFPAPTEGVNRLLLAGDDGTTMEVVMTHKINRELDEPALDSVMPRLPEDFRKLGILVAYKPSLVLSGLRRLTPEQARIFADALTEKPGAPSLVVNVGVEVEALAPDTAPPRADWPAEMGGAEPSRVAIAEFSGSIKKTKPKSKTAAAKRK